MDASVEGVALLALILSDVVLRAFRRNTHLSQGAARILSAVASVARFRKNVLAHGAPLLCPQGDRGGD